MNQTAAPLYRLARHIALVGACLLAGCVYQPDVQQGNLLEEDAIDQVEVGMARTAVQFLLGTPMISDPFHAERWDYPYYLRRGRSNDIQRRWVVVYFEQGRVTRIERDVTLEPNT